MEGFESILDKTDSSLETEEGDEMLDAFQEETADTGFGKSKTTTIPFFVFCIHVKTQV